MAMKGGHIATTPPPYHHHIPLSLPTPLPPHRPTTTTTTSLPSYNHYVKSSVLVRPCLVTFPLRAHVPFFHISYYYLALFLCLLLPLASPLLFPSCVGHKHPCMGSLFPIVHAKWSLVFRSDNIYVRSFHSVITS